MFTTTTTKEGALGIWNGAAIQTINVQVCMYVYAYVCMYMYGYVYAERLISPLIYNHDDVWCLARLELITPTVYYHWSY